MNQLSHVAIKAWAEADRPREKLLEQGRRALTDAELLAILIGSGSREESAVERPVHGPGASVALIGSGIVPVKGNRRSQGRQHRGGSGIGPEKKGAEKRAARDIKQQCACI